MVSSAELVQGSNVEASLLDRYTRVRGTTLNLGSHLAAEDYVVQSMPDASPTKWHLAHTTWFFETFVLAANCDTYQHFDDQYHYLFNSYYYTAGQMHAQCQQKYLASSWSRCE